MVYDRNKFEHVSSSDEMGPSFQEAFEALITSIPVTCWDGPNPHEGLRSLPDSPIALDRSLHNVHLEHFDIGDISYYVGPDRVELSDLGADVHVLDRTNPDIALTPTYQFPPGLSLPDGVSFADLGGFSLPALKEFLEKIGAVDLKVGSTLYC